MFDPGLFLLSYPFILTLAAGALAGASAVLLRRASSFYGRWVVLFVVLLSLGAALAFAWSFYWSWTLVEGTRNAGFPVLAALGGLALVAGIALGAQALFARGMASRRSWAPGRLQQMSPYKHIRRPFATAAFLGLLGETLIVDTVPAYACLLAASLLVHALLELGDWELRLRLPEARPYLDRTPRYIPRRRKKKEPQA
jgi:hypothetical protein